jgi:hypothetical protein
MSARIAAIVADKRALLADFERRRRQEGLRAAGLIEATEKGSRQK